MAPKERFLKQVGATRTSYNSVNRKFADRVFYESLGE